MKKYIRVGAIPQIFSCRPWSEIVDGKEVTHCYGNTIQYSNYKDLEGMSKYILDKIHERFYSWQDDNSEVRSSHGKLPYDWNIVKEELVIDSKTNLPYFYIELESENIDRIVDDKDIKDFNYIYRTFRTICREEIWYNCCDEKWKIFVNPDEENNIKNIRNVPLNVKTLTEKQFLKNIA